MAWAAYVDFFIYFVIPGHVVIIRVTGFTTDTSRILDFTTHSPNHYYLGITVQLGQSFLAFCGSVPQKYLLKGHKLACSSDHSLAVVTHAMAWRVGCDAQALVVTMPPLNSGPGFVFQILGQ